MSTSAMRRMIKGLADREQEAASSYLREIGGRTWQAETPAERAQIGLLVGRNGELPTSLRGGRGEWGSLPQWGAPVLHLLLHHPMLFIDVGAWSEQEFIRRFGVTAAQMATLARKGFVVPSLRFYDSYAASVERDPGGLHSYYREECRHLEVLFCTDETHCRVASIRRRAVLQSLGISEGAPVELWRDILDKAWTKLDGELIREVTGLDPDNAFHSICTHLEYVRLLGAGDPVVATFMDRVRNTGEANAREVASQLRTLNGLKVRLASPITTAFGGVYNVGESQYVNANAAAQLWSAEVLSAGRSAMPKPMSGRYRAGLEAMARLGLSELPFDSIETEALVFETPPSQKAFETYVGFLEANQHLPRKVHEVIGLVQRCRSRGERLAIWRDYIEVIRRAEASVRGERTLSRLVDPSVQGAFGVLAILLGATEALEHGLVFAGACSAAFLLDRHNRWKTKHDPRWRLIGKLDELKRVMP